MILNMVGIGVGGGAELNFDVVGNPKPDSPKENTIWLNTDVDITSWEFSPKTPVSGANGQVFIITGNPLEGLCEFNVFKENTLQVYLLAVKQVIDGVLTTIESFIYQSNAWIPIKCTLCLVPNADKYPASSWSINPVKLSSGSSATQHTITVTASTGVLTFKSTTSGYSKTETYPNNSYTANTREFIDFSVFNTMTVSAKIYFRYFGTSTSGGYKTKASFGFKSREDKVINVTSFSAQIASGKTSVTTDVMTKSIDISNITDSHLFHLEILEEGVPYDMLSTTVTINELVFTT